MSQPPALTRRALLASSTQLAAVLASAGLLPAPAQAQAQAQAPGYLAAAFDARTIAEATDCTWLLVSMICCNTCCGS